MELMKQYVAKYSKIECNYVFNFEMFDDNFFIEMIKIINESKENCTINSVQLTIGENNLEFYNKITNCNNIYEFIDLYLKFKTHLFSIYKLEIFNTDKSFKFEIFEEKDFTFKFLDYNTMINFIEIIHEKIPYYFLREEVNTILANENKICLFKDGILLKRFDSYVGIMEIVKENY